MEAIPADKRRSIIKRECVRAEGPSPISRTVSVDVKHHVYLRRGKTEKGTIRNEVYQNTHRTKD